MQFPEPSNTHPQLKGTCCCRYFSIMELDGVAEAFVQLGGREIVRDSDREWGGLVFSKP